MGLWMSKDVKSQIKLRPESLDHTIMTWAFFVVFQQRASTTTLLTQYILIIYLIRKYSIGSACLLLLIST